MNLIKKNVENIFRLTPMQEGMFYHWIKNPTSDLCFEQASLRLTWLINREAFQGVEKMVGLFKTIHYWIEKQCGRLPEKSAIIYKKDRTVQEAKADIYTSSKPVKPEAYYPLSFAQKRLFILCQMENSIRYNMPAAFRIVGELDKQAFASALQGIVKRHEVLHTSFVMIDTEPMQQIVTNVSVKIKFREGAVGESLENILREFVQPFDLSEAPLMRIQLVRFDGELYLFFDLHHIISDGLSMEILIRDFVYLYNGRVLPELKVQYKDYAVCQNRLLTGKGTTEWLENEERFWLDQFADAWHDELPILTLPTDYSRTQEMAFAGGVINYTLDSTLSTDVKKLAHNHGATLFMTLLAAYTILLARYSGQEDIIIGSPIAGRSHPDLENVMGVFVNFLAHRNYPTGDKEFINLLKEVKKECLEAYDHQDYPFELLVQRLQLERAVNRNPLFDVKFGLQTAVTHDVVTGSLKLMQIDCLDPISKFDISLDVLTNEEEIHLACTYNVQLFKRETVERMLKHYVNILQAIISDPLVQIGRISYLTAEERDQLLRGFNNAFQSLPEVTITQAFNQQVMRSPNRLAVVVQNRSLTYAQLHLEVTKLAKQLRKNGLCREKVVGVMVDRSLEMIIGILGIIKAGGVYLPIDLDYPVERIKYLLQDSGCRLLLTQEGYVGKVRDLTEKVHVILMEPYGIEEDWFTEDMELDLINAGRELVCPCEEHKDWSQLTGPVTQPCIEKTILDEISHPNDLAYVIYTSGTTGQPKGIMVEHEAVVNLVIGVQQAVYKYHEAALRVGFIAPYVFDASVQQIFGALLSGHTLYICSEVECQDGQLLLQFYREHRIQISDGTPAHIRLLNNALGEAESLSVEHFIIDGEALSTQMMLEFYSHLTQPLPLVTNIYGPAECCVDSTAFLFNYLEVTQLSQRRMRTIPIGKPLVNKVIYVLDQIQQLVPQGVIGEIYISGIGLARGYVNNPQLTAQKFLPDPFNSNMTMYRTGDLGRWQADGNLEFMGRTDHQVKIRGYRIELGEIEGVNCKSQEMGRPGDILTHLD